MYASGNTQIPGRGLGFLTVDFQQFYLFGHPALVKDRLTAECQASQPIVPSGDGPSPAPDDRKEEAEQPVKSTSGQRQKL
jgi:hypothetical protein